VAGKYYDRNILWSSASFGAADHLLRGTTAGIEHLAALGSRTRNARENEAAEA
jgi:hypothetical protein